MEKLSSALPKRLFHGEYHRLPLHEEPRTYTDNSVHRLGGNDRKNWRQVAERVLPWLLVLTFACTTIALLVSSSSEASDSCKERKGWTTDFMPATPAIEHEIVYFSGSPAIAENGSLFIPNPDPVRYIGEPNAEVDKNWDELTWGRYFLITEDEAKSAWGDDVGEFWDEKQGGYVAGIDMFHTLHCVDQIRKLLHAPHYNITISTNTALHRDHCLEQIRQYIMCAGDLTPIPTKFYSGLGRNYVDSDYPHTCRNFQKLHDWVLDRYEGASAVHSTTQGP
ncbi:hypothetical protein BT63DRAFT_460949 [Microthyrium microscopicum]|uniref:Uncharacterized protein n=1 Tax=Microthyrium microscopicum TaxID=703497 RepID=A0A6A6TXD3_9PEZI|nr:hypothetical protein BT63DRAFT_460949 [Microthyrium microscopicum]